MDTKDKLPINITFEVVQLPEPNSHWYKVTPVLTWEEAKYSQRMDTALCLQNEISDVKKAICFLVEEEFTIQEMKEQETKLDI